MACLIDEDENGYLCSSATEIAERVVQLVAQPGLAQTLGGAGYQKVVTRYTWEAIAKRVERLYAQLVDSSA